MKQQDNPPNPDARLAAVVKKIVPVFISFGRKDLSILGTPREHPKFRVRDGLLYRLEAIMYNVRTLAHSQGEALQYMKDNFPRSIKQGEDWWVHHGRLQFYLFDNLVFNVVSGFDYLACALGLLYLNKPKFKWNSLVSCARDKGNPFASTIQSHNILQWHSEWVDELHGYRSDVIHFTPDSAQFGTSVQSIGQQTTISFYVKAPERLCKSLPCLIDEENPYLPQSAVRMVDRFLACCDQAFDCVNSELIPHWMKVERDLVERRRQTHPEGEHDPETKG